jgi:hypothetical protein
MQTRKLGVGNLEELTADDIDTLRGFVKDQAGKGSLSKVP